MPCNVLLCANQLATEGEAKFTEDDVARAVPLAKESSRVREAIDRLAAVLAKGYEARALQRVPHLAFLDTDF